MNRLAYAAPIAIVAALLAGCSSSGPNRAASSTITPVEAPYWAGTGVVQAVTPAPAPVSAGPTVAQRPASASSGLQRLRIRMDNGRTMYVDTPSQDFQPGTRVQLSANNEIRKM